MLKNKKEQTRHERKLLNIQNIKQKKQAKINDFVAISSENGHRFSRTLSRFLRKKSSYEIVIPSILRRLSRAYGLLLMSKKRNKRLNEITINDFISGI